MNRRALHLLLVLLITTCPAGRTPLLGAEPNGRVSAAIYSGLTFLGRRQADDGSFSDGASKLSATSLALMAFLATGNTQDVGRHGLIVRRAVEFLIKSAPEATEASDDRCQAVVALAEAYTVESDALQRQEIRAALARSIESMTGAERQDQPGRPGWRLLALRAAQIIGVSVAKADMDRSVALLLRYQQPEGRGFGERPGGEFTAGATALALIALRLLESPGGPDLRPSAQLLAEVPIDPSQSYSSTYYIAQAAAQSGDPFWTRTWTTVSSYLVANQFNDGGWVPSRADEPPGRVYSTSMAVLTLTSPRQILLVHQARPAR